MSRRAQESVRAVSRPFRFSRLGSRVLPARPHVTRDLVHHEAGLSPRQTKRATRLANIPEDEFALPLIPYEHVTIYQVCPQPFSPPEAKARIRSILTVGTVWPTAHAKTEMAKDAMDMVDVTNVLRGGIVEPAEWENGERRYGSARRGACGSWSRSPRTRRTSWSS